MIVRFVLFVSVFEGPECRLSVGAGHAKGGLRGGDASGISGRRQAQAVLPGLSRFAFPFEINYKERRESRAGARVAYAKCLDLRRRGYARAIAYAPPKHLKICGSAEIEGLLSRHLRRGMARFCTLFPLLLELRRTGRRAQRCDHFVMQDSGILGFGWLDL